MNLLLEIWNQPNWVKWVIYIAIIYVLYLLLTSPLMKEAFAIVLWILFCFLLYFIIFAKNMIQGKTYYEKKID